MLTLGILFLVSWQTVNKTVEIKAKSSVLHKEDFIVFYIHLLV